MQEGDTVQTPDGQGTVNTIMEHGQLVVVLDDGDAEVYHESEVY